MFVFISCNYREYIKKNMNKSTEHCLIHRGNTASARQQNFYGTTFSYYNQTEAKHAKQRLVGQ